MISSAHTSIETTAQRMRRLRRSGTQFSPRRPAGTDAVEGSSLPSPDFMLLTPNKFAERHHISESDVLHLIEFKKIAAIQLVSGIYISIPDADRDLRRLMSRMQ